MPSVAAAVPALHRPRGWRRGESMAYVDLGGLPVADPLPPSVLAIDRQGALHWNGVALPDAALPERLAALQKSGAVLHLQTDPEARYDRFDGILATVKRAGITRLGFVGNRPLED